MTAYLLTPGQHAQIVDALTHWTTPNWAGACVEQCNEALAMLKAMTPVEPCASQFQASDGDWHPFLDDKHYQNTKEDGRWPIRELYTIGEMG